MKKCSCSEEKAGLSRRNFLKVTLVGGAVVAVNGFERAQAEARAQGALAIEAGDILVHAEGDKKGEALTLTELPSAEDFKDMPAILLNPMNPETSEVKTGEANTLVVARVSAEAMPEAVTDYATATGVVVFSAICTHFNCLVERMNSKGLIACACHGSVFDPAQAAEPVDGPAPYALSMLPIEQTEEETFRVTGDFNFPLPS